MDQADLTALLAQADQQLTEAVANTLHRLEQEQPMLAQSSGFAVVKKLVAERRFGDLQRLLNGGRLAMEPHRAVALGPEVAKRVKGVLGDFAVPNL